MNTPIISSVSDWPNSPKAAPSASWPRYVNNTATRAHLDGKKLSAAVLKLELEKLRVVWRQVQRTRQRDAVYEFLEAVFEVVSRFNRAGAGKKLLRKLHRLDPRLKRMRGPYSAVIHFATDYLVDNRTSSKWSRLLRFAERTKKRNEPLDDFIRRNGGINECAVLFRQRKRGV